MNRYHDKNHRHNHHTSTTGTEADSANDPIASESDPFQGSFYIDGNYIFTGSSSTISADTGTVTMGSTLYMGSGNNINIGDNIIENYYLNTVVDVDAETPSDNQLLTWDDDTSMWINQDPRLTTISDIEDVTITDATANEALIWDGTEWVNGYPYAVYADLAENYIVDTYCRFGSIVAISDGIYDVELCTRRTFDKMVGAVTDTPGMLLDADLKGGTPVSYIGKVDLLITGSCKKGDIIVLSKLDGVCKTAGRFDKKYKIGYATESKTTHTVAPVKCVIKTL